MKNFRSLGIPGILALGCFLAFIIFAGAGCSAAEQGKDISFTTVGDVDAGQPDTLELSGPTSLPADFKLPTVDGLTVNGSGTDPYTKPPSCSFFVTPAHAGDYKIPEFYIHCADGQVFHVLAYTLHVTGG